MYRPPGESGHVFGLGTLGSLYPVVLTIGISHYTIAFAEFTCYKNTLKFAPHLQCCIAIERSRP